MQRMRPTQKTVTISDVFNDTLFVKVFDFKQELLSLLRDESNKFCAYKFTKRDVEYLQ